MSVSREDLLKTATMLVLAALALTIWVDWQGVPLPGDLWLIHRIQDGGQLRDNAYLVNDAGSWVWAPVAGAIILVLLRGRVWRTAAIPSRREALSAFAAAIVLWRGDALVKRIIESPRPTITAGITIDGHFSGYGYPSGHVYDDVLFYGLLAVLAPAFLPRRLVLPARVVAVAIVICAGPARIAVGAHWPSDTLGGYLWGGMMLCIAVWFGRWVAQRR
ncbi:MAG: phosphatase PAP2 family protein [Tepidiformaceae bacterium]